jgi:dsRNA-specific ribonuclease
MKTLHSGTNEFPFETTTPITYNWKFEEAEDHEHPYILTVTVAEHTHSEGYGRDIGETEASAKADKLAREVYATTQVKP